jgi:hypothetical protein
LATRNQLWGELHQASRVSAILGIFHIISISIAEALQITIIAWGNCLGVTTMKFL